MLTPLEEWFARQSEPTGSCLQMMRALILRQDARLTEQWKYGMPFYCLGRKMVFYLWVHKKFHQPYLGFVDGRHLNHESLLLEKRSKMKIFLIDPSMDLPIKTIQPLIRQALALYSQKKLKFSIKTPRTSSMISCL